MVATKPPLVRAVHIRKALAVVRPGDVLCRKYTYYFDSHFIKGEYTHSGVVIDNETMIHSIAEGVGRVDIIDFIKDADGFIVLRPKNIEYDKEKMFGFLKTNCGKPYDFIFKRDKDAFYCHELTYEALKAGGYPVPSVEGIIYAEHLIEALEVVYQMESEKV
jgi:uncharacterized protein YycO